MLNTEEFLQTTVSESLDDFLEPCPPGEWLAVSGKPDIATFEYKKGERKGQTGYQMVTLWEIQDEEVKRMLGRDTVRVRHSVILDVTADGHGLETGKGKNIGLGEIRTALGQNTPGQQWSPAMIEGQLAKLKIKAGINPKNDRVTAEVAALTAA